MDPYSCCEECYPEVRHMLVQYRTTSFRTCWDELCFMRFCNVFTQLQGPKIPDAISLSARLVCQNLPAIPHNDSCALLPPVMAQDVQNSAAARKCAVHACLDARLARYVSLLHCSHTPEGYCKCRSGFQLGLDMDECGLGVNSTAGPVLGSRCLMPHSSISSGTHSLLPDNVLARTPLRHHPQESMFRSKKGWEHESGACYQRVYPCVYPSNSLRPDRLGQLSVEVRYPTSSMTSATATSIKLS